MATKNGGGGNFLLNSAEFWPTALANNYTNQNLIIAPLQQNANENNGGANSNDNNCSNSTINNNNSSSNAFQQQHFPDKFWEQQQQQQQQQQQVITIALQYGPMKELVIVERTADMGAFELFRQKARQMVEKQLQLESSISSNGGHPTGTSAQVTASEVQLFLHDYKSFNMLTCLTSLAQLDNGSVVEIIRIDRSEKPTKPHLLQVNTFVTPTFCDYCGEMLIGLIKQGVQCRLCKCNFHKKCALAPRNNCAKSETVPTTFLAGAGQFPVPNIAGMPSFCSLLIRAISPQLPTIGLVVASWGGLFIPPQSINGNADSAALLNAILSVLHLQFAIVRPPSNEGQETAQQMLNKTLIEHKKRLVIENLVQTMRTLNALHKCEF
ncbi:hypothetical protein niasHT_032835 [Heterodera trifolii]|uniref:Phorbol-ester/DAG-type domain-containing protein n=1 Tax=Heterodera trifolii TaxID=157864 RepID=A0ABD2IWC6_9BILA